MEQFTIYHGMIFIGILITVAAAIANVVAFKKANAVLRDSMQNALVAQSLLDYKGMRGNLATYPALTP